MFDRLRRLWARESLIRMGPAQWSEMTTELARRGQRIRESGCFLLSDAAGDHRRVVELIYFDDLDPNCLTGGISIEGLVFADLWRYCRAHGLRVIADVHTHPGSWVGQSSTDQENPMVSQPGHVAVILPNFAQHAPLPSDSGVHLYQGSAGWKSWRGKAAARRLYVGRLA